jgi:hypothetical protein
MEFKGVRYYPALNPKAVVVHFKVDRGGWSNRYLDIPFSAIESRSLGSVRMADIDERDFEDVYLKWGRLAGRMLRFYSAKYEIDGVERERVEGPMLVV